MDPLYPRSPESEWRERALKAEALSERRREMLAELFVRLQAIGQHAQECLSTKVAGRFGSMSWQQGDSRACDCGYGDDLSRVERLLGEGAK